MWTCTGCSCLCEDVEIDGDNVRHACRIGAEIFRGRSISRPEPLIGGKKVDIDSAIEEAVEILKDSKCVAIYGLNRSTLEAQREALKLAEKLSAFVDNGSEFDRVVGAILEGRIITTTLEDVRDNAFVQFYWKCDVHNSMPRLMARTYYARGGRRQRGYEEDRYLVVVDVRRSHTAALAKKNASFIRAENDEELIREFLKALKGGVAGGDVMRIAREVRKSDFNVIFGGTIDAPMELLEEFVREVGYFVPTDYRTNSMGFFKIFGKRDELKDVVESLDALIVVGDDPMDDVGFETIKRILKLKIIAITPKVNFISKFADVVIPSAISGLECGGKMLRCDFKEVELKPMFKGVLSDEKILRSISGGL